MSVTFDIMVLLPAIKMLINGSKWDNKVFKSDILVFITTCLAEKKCLMIRTEGECK